MANGNFTAHLGSSDNPGLLPLEERLSWISKGENPFQADSALPENSPGLFRSRKPAPPFPSETLH